MSAELNKSLDEIIKDDSSSKRSRNGSQRRRGGPRNGSNRSPYTRVNKINPMLSAGSYNPAMMQNQALMMQAMATAMNKPSNDQKGKILISNLDYKVTEADLRELFQQIGGVRKAALNFDSRGKSKGNGEVIFSKASDAYRALEKYNGVTLDGRGRGRGGNRRGGRDNNNNRRKPTTKEDLDADMDTYMQIDELKPDSIPASSSTL
ncbi:hypothetical protein BB561_001797 [Smittium simulii]|uniref:RRM domain-containing protein n=1 Tax=Smittium simulii TaxID=133385 RepID=A0A2T9YSZ8_9FUNG|nr:hypothetical protein BB561_001797 [Smittium simulii]